MPQDGSRIAASPNAPVDAVVIGGGPSGSAVARLLALWGHNVVVLAGGRSRRPGLAESLPPSCRKPFTLLGVLDAVESAGFVETRGNTSSWGGGPLRNIPFEGCGSGYQVRRRHLDDLLLGCAESAGAAVLREAVATDVELPSGLGQLGSVRWRFRGQEASVNARWILDASGRAGVVARMGFRKAGSGASTLALVGTFAQPKGWALEDESHTLVESYEDGWAWSVPTGGDSRYVAAMVDPRLSSLSRGAGIERMYLAELAKTTHLRRILKGARRIDPAWACCASPYGAHQHSADGVLLLGDAGSFLDPLSSFGVKKALASGWLGAVAVHTALTKPKMTGAARSLFEEREREAHMRYQDLAGHYYSEAAGFHDHPYWRVRSPLADPRSSSLDEDGAADSERLLRDPRVPAAFNFLRGDTPLRLRAAESVRREWRPTVQGREVVLEEHLIAPSLPGGIHTIRGVRLPRLMDIVDQHEQVPDLYEAFAQTGPQVQLPDFLCALSALLATGVVESGATH